MSTIHPTAIVHPDAQLADDVVVGPFCIIEADVQVGRGTQLLSHVTLANGARIGCDVRIYPGAVIGTAPQDLKYAGEPTLAIIGDRTTIRECVTVNRGTVATGKAQVGNDVLLMAYVHVAHDCVVSDKVIIANSTQLGGHVEIGYHAVVGGLCALHQFTWIGAHTMIAGGTRVVKDIPPFTLAAREPVCIEGLNTVGLRRRGFSSESIAELNAFYRFIYAGGRNISDALREYEASHPSPSENILSAIAFIRSSKRGIARWHDQIGTH